MAPSKLKVGKSSLKCKDFTLLRKDCKFVRTAPTLLQQIDISHFYDGKHKDLKIITYTRSPKPSKHALPPVSTMLSQKWGCITAKENPRCHERHIQKSCNISGDLPLHITATYSLPLFLAFAISFEMIVSQFRSRSQYILWASLCILLSFYQQWTKIAAAIFVIFLQIFFLFCN